MRNRGETLLTTASDYKLEIARNLLALKRGLDRLLDEHGLLVNKIEEMREREDQVRNVLQVPYESDTLAEAQLLMLRLGALQPHNYELTQRVAVLEEGLRELRIQLAHKDVDKTWASVVQGMIDRRLAPNHW